MLSRSQSIAVVVALAAAAPCSAQSRGWEGRAGAAPATKDAGVSPERSALPARDLPLEPRHGLLGAPGTAPDSEGPSRLGAGAPSTDVPTYGEAAGNRGGGQSLPRWQSGDRVRSPTSTDVRLARLQEAPDIEFVGGGGAAGAEETAGGEEAAPQKASASAKPPEGKAQKKAQGRKRR